MKSIKEFLQVLFADKSSKKFSLSVILGLSFSMSVILCTLGLMDGYVNLFKTGLSQFEGDLNIHSRDGFFEVDELIKESFKKVGVTEYSALVQSEGFIVHDQTSKGVLFKGVEPESFSKVVREKIQVAPGEVILGKDLALSLGAKEGQNLSVVLSDGGRQVSGMPSVHQLKVVGLIDHKIYEKNMRTAYLNLEHLSQIMELNNRVNMVSVRFAESKTFIKDENALESKIIDLEDHLGYDFVVRPFWYGLSSIFSAVKAEKFMIGLAVQLIVVVSMFNVVAFIIYFNEKRSKEIFLLKALGMSSGVLLKGWASGLFLFWLLSCLGSMVFTAIFNVLLKKLFIFQLPGDVYKIVSLEIYLSAYDYLAVFISSLLWFVLMSFGVFKKIKKQEVLAGLRQEFA
jgi:ABC-type lipoprotein release transport system permease subunit